MRIVLISILFALTLSVFGQNRSLGLKGGIGLNNANSKEFLVDTENRVGFTFGLTYEAELKKQIVVGADLLYSQKGFTDEFVLVTDQGEILGEKTSRFNYDY